MSNWDQQKFNDIVSAITNAANKIKNSNVGSYVLVPEKNIPDELRPMKITIEEYE
jgi:hypothetical protein